MTTSRRIPTYRKHKPTNQAVVTLNGKDHYLGRFGSPVSREKYARLIAEWIEGGPRPGKSEPCGVAEASISLTVSELILGYLRHCLDYYRDSPWERDKIRMALRPVRKLYGRSKAIAFGPLALRAVRAEMCKTLARRTINQRCDIVRRMFKWAVGTELLPSAVYEALRAVEGLKRGRSTARETEAVRPVPDELVEKTLPWVNRHVRGMIEFERLTGCRPGEVCLLRPCDIDMSGEVWGYRPWRHKNAYRGHDRVILIGPRAQAVLNSFLDIGPDDYLFCPRRMMDERYVKLRRNRKSRVPPSQMSRKKALARNRLGDRYDTKSFYHAVRKACKRAGIDLWHPNQLRHSVATELRKDFGIDTARIILGQKHLSTTEIYAEMDIDKAREVMARVG